MAVAVFTKSLPSFDRCLSLALSSVFVFITQIHLAQYNNIAPSMMFHNVNEGTQYGNGISCYDFNRDGWDDLTMANGAEEPWFFVNDHGSLIQTNINLTLNPVSQVIMLLWTDIENDGDSDLLVSQWIGPLQLWRNDGNGSFTNIAPESGLDQGVWMFRGASFADYDHDGFPDLYVCKYYDLLNNYNPDHTSQLYHNNGDGTFTDVTVSSGVYLSPRPVFQSVFMDYNYDGWEDLYLVIDRNPWANELFENNGDGTFTNVSQSSGANPAMDAMCATVGDFDNDADLDLYAANGTQGNKLYRNNNDETFTEIAAAAGVAVNLICWGSLWMDYDNNTWQDLFVGTTLTFFGTAQNAFFINNGNSTFSDGNQIAGFEGDTAATMVVARGDINRDGYFDFATNNNDPFESQIWLNDGGDANYLSVSLEGSISNRDGIGSWIHAYAGENHFVRYTMAGDNYCSQNSGVEIFGLGEIEFIDSLVVEWNRGTQDVFYDVEANQVLHIREGDSFEISVLLSISNNLILCEGDSVTLDVGEFENVLWNNGFVGRELVAYEPGLYYADITDEFGNTWRSDSVEVLLSPFYQATFITTPTSCHNTNDGTATLNVSQEDVMSINWDNGDALLTADSLHAGLHLCLWFDINGCSQVDTVEIIAPEQLQMDFELTDVSCYDGNDGSCVATASGGTPPYVYNYEDDLNGNVAGKYYAMVTDANGCEQAEVYFIGQPAPLVAEFNLIQPQCYTSADGSADVIVNGGTEPYTIDWMSIDSQALANGAYSLIITDSHQCVLDTGFILFTDSIQVDITFANVNCYGGNDGFIEVEASDDITINWNDVDPTTLEAGFYEMNLSNDVGCKQHYFFEIHQPEELICEVVTMPYIESVSPGYAVVNASGGVPEYNYDWEFSSSEIDTAYYSFSGNFYVEVVDHNGCFCSTEFDIDVVFGLEELNNNFMVSPNPADQQFIFTSEEFSAVFFIYDPTGKLIYTDQINSSQTTVETSKWSNGVYSFVMKNGTKELSSQIMVFHR